MACRTARALSTLRAEIRKQFPQRDERSDGGCASSSHTQQNPSSHHEPNSAGVATAHDYDEDLHGAGAIADEMPTIAEHLRALGKGGDRRVRYIIYELRICSRTDNWAWRPYTGPNAHEHHLHLSTDRDDPAVYDSTKSWGIAGLFQGDDDMGLTTDERAVLDAIRDATAQLVAVAHRDIDTLRPLLEQVLQEVKDDPNTGTGHGDVDAADFVEALKDALVKGTQP